MPEPLRSCTPAIAGALVLAATAAHAGPDCPTAGHTWVKVVTEERPATTRRVVQHLRAELAARRIDVCEVPSERAPPAAASVRILRSDATTVGITVEVRDAITDKQLSREIDLSGVPADARPMTIALGAAELLRASWAELALSTSPPPKAPVPPEIRQSVADAMPPAGTAPRPRRGTVGLFAAGEEFTGRLVQFGADARAALRLTDRLDLTARVGGRAAQPVRVRDGRVQAVAWIAGTGASFALLPRAASAGVDLFVRADLMGSHFFAEPRGGAAATSAGGTALLATGGVSGWVALGPSLYLNGDIGAGTTLRGVRALDGNRTVAAASGFVVVAGAGVAVPF